MFRAVRWRVEKNKIKLVFKLQFRATQVPQLGWDTLIVALVSLQVGKPTVKFEIAVIHDESCGWKNPIYETVKLIWEPKTEKINDKIYQFFYFHYMMLPSFSFLFMQSISCLLAVNFVGLSRGHQKLVFLEKLQLILQIMLRQSKLCLFRYPLRLQIPRLLCIVGVAGCYKAGSY